MRCPACNVSDTKVLDSRVASDGFSIRRRRECLKCGFRFSTYEEVEILDLTIVKRDGRKESYSREKLTNGLKKSLEKRPITEENFKKLVSRIERDLQLLRKSEITSQQIGQIVMKELRKTDQVAYIRYASVYESFKDAQTFHRELNKLLKENKSKRAVKIKKKY
ncbi:transcriptional regulator NrdR [Candidatus Falkowbacteria bacterium RIFCSPLOWO2_12_FULL_45_10]|uniref:Transcriptional repressor NrdR n=4 Tax=Candidatus Falkowiibacteriota TaxID=1752728 RepID=A0A1F5RVK8_9BACT|nr:MAG: transcriptional regulator NrdR [Candidatus Falkowbacteria bacterium RIFCSPHIGHO2_02_FULL_45_15]OGF18591.1 MAG: transcriptional regulator NrdR [Candidatus Falkowbacteria bacterium RIFCSPLOWO2_12_FULL_45_10]